MIFAYDELKEYIEEDFNRFYEMGFNEAQIFPAVLDEYQYGKDFSQVENICIHIFLVLNYAEKKWNYNKIIGALKKLMTETVENEVMLALESEYTKYIADLDNIRNIKACNEENGLLLHEI